MKDSERLPERTIGPAATEKEPLPPRAEMVERVARALCEASDLDWEDQAHFTTTTSGGAGEDEQEVYRTLARAAITAMREPTAAMMTAMQESGVFDEVNGMISFCHARGSHKGGLTKAPMPAAYTIMVDAALAAADTSDGKEIPGGNQ